MAIEWKEFRKAAKSRRPRYRHLRRMDRDDWLASIGLERRNVAADVFGALGLLALGAGIGFTLGLFYAPKSGAQFRREVGERWRGRMEHETAHAEASGTGYVS